MNVGFFESYTCHYEFIAVDVQRALCVGDGDEACELRAVVICLFLILEKVFDFVGVECECHAVLTLLAVVVEADVGVGINNEFGKFIALFARKICAQETALGVVCVAHGADTVEGLAQRVVEVKGVFLGVVGHTVHFHAVAKIHGQFGIELGSCSGEAVLGVVATGRYQYYEAYGDDEIDILFHCN